MKIAANRIANEPEFKRFGPIQAYARSLDRSRFPKKNSLHGQGFSRKIKASSFIVPSELARGLSNMLQQNRSKQIPSSHPSAGFPASALSNLRSPKSAFNPTIRRIGSLTLVSAMLSISSSLNAQEPVTPILELPSPIRIESRPTNSDHSYPEDVLNCAICRQRLGLPALAPGERVVVKSQQPIPNRSPLLLLHPIPFLHLQTLPREINISSEPHPQRFP